MCIGLLPSSHDWIMPVALGFRPSLPASDLNRLRFTRMPPRSLTQPMRLFFNGSRPFHIEQTLMLALENISAPGNALDALVKFQLKGAIRTLASDQSFLTGLEDCKLSSC